MKNLIFLITFLLSFEYKFGFAQSLVPNGSFENYSICPDGFGQIYRANSWFQPHKYPGGFSVNQSSSSDYFNSCVDSASQVGVPNNVSGFQFAKTGNAYIGLALYSPYFNGNAFREYAEVKLSQTLSANKKYNLKFFVSLSNGSRFSITKFDAYLSNDSLLFTSTNYFKIPVSPQIQYNGRINDTLNWVEVNGNYIAVGNENYLTIGNFHDGSVCDTLRTPYLATNGFAGYLIDDVSLEEDTITGINEINKSDFIKFPNPAKSNMNINSHQLIQELSLIDFRQRIIITLNPNNTNTQVDISQIDDGIYIVQCKFKNGEVLYKKIVVQH